MNIRKVAAISFGVLLLMVVLWSVAGARKAFAQTEVIPIPKSFGALKGSIGACLIFEDSSGTIRLIQVRDEWDGKTFVRR